jgi:hypothetical protein
LVVLFQSRPVWRSTNCPDSHTFPWRTVGRTDRNTRRLCIDWRQFHTGPTSSSTCTRIYSKRANWGEIPGSKFRKKFWPEAIRLTVLELDAPETQMLSMRRFHFISFTEIKSSAIISHMMGYYPILLGWYQLQL